VRLRFACLGTGSRGNAVVVEADGTRVLVDCGFSLRETERRLARLGLAIDDLHAILLTHEHSDHAAGVGRVARRAGIKIYATHGTLRATRLRTHAGALPITPEQCFTLGALEIQAYPLPHDATEPCQFVIGNGAERLGLLTDAGHVSAHMRQILDGCDALLLETNHDPDMLARGPYHPALKQRVGGDYGHLSNAQGAALLVQMDTTRLQHLVAGHLSEQNNTPEEARAALAEALGCDTQWIAVADQDEGLSWREITCR
jgi:phosphoribosyl 1,2-cyclic phosphodiesterase